MDKRLFNLLKKIPKGKVTTYGILARKLKCHPRKIAAMLRKNKKLIVIPCHRVVYINGKVGGYVKGKKEKIKLLKKEGLEIVDEKIINFKQVLFKF